MKRILLCWTVAITGIILFLTGVPSALALDLTPPANGGNVTLPNPLSSLGSNATLLTVVQAVASFLLFVAAPLCGIMVIVGGFQMITAAGNPKQFGDGRKTLIYAAIGFIVVLFASSIVPLLKNILSGT